MTSEKNPDNIGQNGDFKFGGKSPGGVIADKLTYISCVQLILRGIPTESSMFSGVLSNSEVVANMQVENRFLRRILAASLCCWRKQLIRDTSQ